MKKFNITAQVMDMCGDNPGQSILYNEVIESYDRTKAEKQFSFDLLVDNIIVQKFCL
jgi:hypothetical protein